MKKTIQLISVSVLLLLSAEAAAKFKHFITRSGDRLMEGGTEYASFRNKARNAFWTDPELIADFKKTIEYVLNRKNVYTGVRYKDDKAILAWETGNELSAPQAWTHEIASFIHSIDKNHLVADGFTIPVLRDETLNDTAAAARVSDAEFPYRPLFYDTSAGPGSDYWYRVRSGNKAGISAPSAVAGPVRFSGRIFVDELKDGSSIQKDGSSIQKDGSSIQKDGSSIQKDGSAIHKDGSSILSMDGPLSFETNSSRKTKEDMNRLHGRKGGIVVYRPDGPVIRWRAYAFVQDSSSGLHFFASKDGAAFTRVEGRAEAFETGKDFYGTWRPVLYSFDNPGDGARFIKIEFTGDAQLARMEIAHE